MRFTYYAVSNLNGGGYQQAEHYHFLWAYTHFKEKDYFLVLFEVTLTANKLIVLRTT